MYGMQESEVNMWEMIIGELDHAMQELARGFAHLLPRVLAMLIIALLGWMVAYVYKVALPSSSELLSRVVFWVVWLGFILLGVQVLGIVFFQEYISRFFLFLPR